MDQNSFFQKGIGYCSKALEFDALNNHSDAFTSYLTAVEFLMDAYYYEKSEKTKERIKLRIKDILDRAEQLRLLTDVRYSLLSREDKVPPSNVFVSEKRKSTSEWFESENEGKTKFSFGGAPVDQKHDSYKQLLAIMTGMKTTIENLANWNLTHHICGDDFITNHEVNLCVDSNDFVFVSVAPLVFHQIKGIFGVENDSFLKSLSGNFLELKSPGKSNSFLYFTSNYKYILKTIDSWEADTMRRILPAYFYYVLQNSETLLTRFLGFHVLKHNGQETYFVIMENVFPLSQLDYCYDLKGSTKGRAAKPEDKESGRAVLKDLDVSPGAFQIHSEDRKRLFKQMKSDCDFLETNSLMDYSFLVGVKRNDHDINVETTQQTPETKNGDIFQTRKRRGSYFKKDKGGLISRDGKVVFYFGVIDILTTYGWVKFFENSAKTMVWDEMSISAVNPNLYRSRFEYFMSTHCFDSF